MPRSHKPPSRPLSPQGGGDAASSHEPSDQRPDTGIEGARSDGVSFESAVEHDLEHSIHDLPVDPDVPREPPAEPKRAHPRLRDVVGERKDILAVIAAGGAIGSLGRWGLGVLLPHEAGQFAWSTFTVNVSGAFLLGLLMALMVDVLATTRYVRPFIGVGVLGGWTTFSTYMSDTRAMLAADRVPAGLLLYLGGTLLVGLVCVWVGLITGRAAVVAAVRGHRRRHGHEVSADRPEDGR